MKRDRTKGAEQTTGEGRQQQPSFVKDASPDVAAVARSLPAMTLERDFPRPPVGAADVAALIAAADREGHAGIGTAIALVYEFGLRPGEALALTRANFDEGCHLMERDMTTFLVSPQLRKRIRAALATSAYVVVRPKGKPWRDARPVFLNTFRRICRAAGVSDAVSLWDVRLAGVRRMVEAGSTPPPVDVRRRRR